jgi:hypothetical protein
MAGGYPFEQRKTARTFRLTGLHAVHTLAAAIYATLLASLWSAGVGTHHSRLPAHEDEELARSKSVLMDANLHYNDRFKYNIVISSRRPCLRTHALRLLLPPRPGPSSFAQRKRGHRLSQVQRQPVALYMP